MKDGSRAAEQVDVSRQEVYEDYENFFLQQCVDVGPCREACLLKKAARYLLREPGPRETFTMIPFHQALKESCGALSTDCRKPLSAFIKAAELLETICVNLFLQPWRKEIKTLKTFTGPFVYCLLPVLSSCTLQSVLASIGYLPHTGTPQSEYRLSEDANPDRAMLVGFELLLARVECYRLLELLDKDQLGPQELLRILQRKVGRTQLEEPTEKKTTIGPKKEEEEKKEEADRKEVAPYLDTRLAVNPQPKPRRCHLISVDQSIMEMQMTYPDLAFRGRPLLPDKPHRASTSRSSSKAVGTASTNDYSDDSEAAELSTKDRSKDAKAAATTKNNGSKAAEVFGDDGRSSGCSDRNSGRTTGPGDATSSSIGKTDGGRVDDELSHCQGISLHITLRAGSTAEPPACTQQTPADLQNQRPANPELPSLSSLDEEQELRALAERTGQLHVLEAKEESKRKDENKRGEENTNKERRKKERKVSTDREAEEQSVKRPTMETGPGPSHGASRSDRAAMKEQKQPAVSHPSPLTVSAVQCKRGGTGKQKGEDTVTGRGEEEQLAQSYVIVEHHRK